MKKPLLIAAILSLPLAGAVFANGYITLNAGQTIDINGTTVSCVGSTLPTNPIAECNRFKGMSPESVYQLGYTVGVGNCTIINNGGYYGVVHTAKGQISPTYTEGYGSGSVYDPYSMSAATALVQLVCNRSCYEN